MEKVIDPDADIDFGENITTRKPWLIVLLAVLFSQFAFIYCGRIRRALAWFFLKWLLGFASVALMLYAPLGRIAFFGGCAILLATYLALITDALRVGQEQCGQRRRPYQKWWTYLLIVCVVVVVDSQIPLGVSKAWQEAFVMPSGSMRETLLPGDRFLVDKVIHRLTTLERGQVAVFYSPDKRGILSVKRVIAVAGDTLQFVEGKVHLNGEEVEDPSAYYLGENHNRFEEDNYGPITVPEGHFFVLGDNRWASRDSRHFGYVPEENLVGIAKVIFWSREFEYIRPSRENPRGGEKWGKLRWDRIGMRVQ